MGESKNNPVIGGKPAPTTISEKGYVAKERFYDPNRTVPLWLPPKEKMKIRPSGNWLNGSFGIKGKIKF